MQVAQFHIHARKPRGGRKKTSPRGQKESHGRERSGKSRIAASLSYQESPMIHRRFAFLLALGLALPVHAASGDAAHFYVYRMQSGPPKSSRRATASTWTGIAPIAIRCRG